MGVISRFINKRVLDTWADTIARISVNRYEATAISHAIEAMEHLIDARDGVDAVRDTIRRAGSASQLLYDPTPYQQKRLFRAVCTYFDAYYSTVSAWAGVVARFNDVFGRTFKNNTTFLAWFSANFPEQGDSSAELERARAFRAMLAHPQSFPAYTWATFANQGTVGLITIVVHGPYGRGAQKMPPGAAAATPGSALADGWRFEAPDEVSVTNCVSMLAESVLATVLSSRTTKSAFARTLGFDEAIQLLEKDVEVSGLFAIKGVVEV